MKNIGPNPALGVTLEDALPSPLAAVSTPTPGRTITGNTLPCAFGDMNPGSERTVTLVAPSRTPAVAPTVAGAKAT